MLSRLRGKSKEPPKAAAAPKPVPVAEATKAPDTSAVPPDHEVGAEPPTTEVATAEAAATSSAAPGSATSTNTTQGRRGSSDGSTFSSFKLANKASTRFNRFMSRNSDNKEPTAVTPPKSTQAASEPTEALQDGNSGAEVREEAPENGETEQKDDGDEGSEGGATADSDAATNVTAHEPTTTSPTTTAESSAAARSAQFKAFSNKSADLAGSFKAGMSSRWSRLNSRSPDKAKSPSGKEARKSKNGGGNEEDDDNSSRGETPREDATPRSEDSSSARSAPLATVSAPDLSVHVSMEVGVTRRLHVRNMVAEGLPASLEGKQLRLRVTALGEDGSPLTTSAAAALAGSTDDEQAPTPDVNPVDATASQPEGVAAEDAAQSKSAVENAAKAVGTGEALLVAETGPITVLPINLDAPSERSGNDGGGSASNHSEVPTLECAWPGAQVVLGVDARAQCLRIALCEFNPPPPKTKSSSSTSSKAAAAAVAGRLGRFGADLLNRSRSMSPIKSPRSPSSQAQPTVTAEAAAAAAAEEGAAMRELGHCEIVLPPWPLESGSSGSNNGEEVGAVQEFKVALVDGGEGAHAGMFVGLQLESSSPADEAMLEAGQEGDKSEVAAAEGATPQSAEVSDPSTLDQGGEGEAGESHADEQQVQQPLKAKGEEGAEDSKNDDDDDDDGDGKVDDASPAVSVGVTSADAGAEEQKGNDTEQHSLTGGDESPATESAAASATTATVAAAGYATAASDDAPAKTEVAAAEAGQGSPSVTSSTATTATAPTDKIMRSSEIANANGSSSSSSSSGGEVPADAAQPLAGATPAESPRTSLATTLARPRKVEYVSGDSTDENNDNDDGKLDPNFSTDSLVSPAVVVTVAPEGQSVDLADLLSQQPAGLGLPPKRLVFCLLHASASGGDLQGALQGTAAGATGATDVQDVESRRGKDGSNKNLLLKLLVNGSEVWQSKATSDIGGGVIGTSDGVSNSTTQEGGPATVFLHTSPAAEATAMTRGGANNSRGVGTVVDLPAASLRWAETGSGPMQVRLELWRSNIFLGTAALPAHVLASLRSGFHSGSGYRSGPQEWVERGAAQVVELNLGADSPSQLATPRGITGVGGGGYDSNSGAAPKENLTVRMELSLGVASAMVAVGKSHQGPFDKRAIRKHDASSPQAKANAAADGRAIFSGDGDGDGDGEARGPELSFAESPRVGEENSTTRASRFARTVAALAGGGRDRANKTALSIKVLEAKPMGPPSAMKLLSGIQSTFVRLRMLRIPLSSRRKNAAANIRVAPMASGVDGNSGNNEHWAGPTNGADLFPPTGSSVAAAVAEAGDMRISWQGAIARLSLQGGGMVPPPLPARGTSPNHRQGNYGFGDDDDDDDEYDDDDDDGNEDDEDEEGDEELMAVACVDGAVRASMQSRRSGQYRSLGERVSVELVGLVPDHENADGDNNDHHDDVQGAAGAVSSADGGATGASREGKVRMREVVLGSVETSLRSLLRQSLRGSAELRSTSADGTAHGGGGVGSEEAAAAAAAAVGGEAEGEGATLAVNTNSSYSGGLMLEVPPEEATALALAAMRASMQSAQARKSKNGGGEGDVSNDQDGHGENAEDNADDDDDNEGDDGDGLAEPLRWALQFDALLEADHSSAILDADANDVVEGANEPVLLPAFANEVKNAAAGTTPATEEGGAAAAASSEELFRVPHEDPMVDQRAKLKASQARAKELVRRRNQRNLEGGGGGTSASVPTSANTAQASSAALSSTSSSSSSAAGLNSRRIPAWRSPERAATYVQAIWRGRWQRVRKQRQQTSAVCVQRFWRGWQQRQVALVHSEVAAKARRVAAANAARGHRRQVLEAELDRLKSTTGAIRAQELEQERAKTFARTNRQIRRNAAEALSKSTSKFATTSATAKKLNAASEDGAAASNENDAPKPATEGDGGNVSAAVPPATAATGRTAEIFAMEALENDALATKIAIERKAAVLSAQDGLHHAVKQLTQREGANSRQLPPLSSPSSEVFDLGAAAEKSAARRRARAQRSGGHDASAGASNPADIGSSKKNNKHHRSTSTRNDNYSSSTDNDSIYVSPGPEELRHQVYTLARNRRNAENKRKTAAAHSADDKTPLASKTNFSGSHTTSNSNTGGKNVNTHKAKSNNGSSGLNTYGDLLTAKHHVATLLQARQVADWQWAQTMIHSKEDRRRYDNTDYGATSPGGEEENDGEYKHVEGAAAAAASAARKQHGSHLRNMIDFLQAPPSLAVARSEGINLLLQSPPGVSALDDESKAEKKEANSGAGNRTARAAGAPPLTSYLLLSSSSSSSSSPPPPPSSQQQHPSRVAMQRTVAALRAERPWWCASLPEDLGAVPKDIRRFRAGTHPQSQHNAPDQLNHYQRRNGTEGGPSNKSERFKMPAAIGWPFQEWREGEVKMADAETAAAAMAAEGFNDNDKAENVVKDENTTATVKSTRDPPATDATATMVDDAEASRWWYAWARRMQAVDASTGQTKVTFLDVVDAHGRSQAASIGQWADIGPLGRRRHVEQQLEQLNARAKEWANALTSEVVRQRKLVIGPRRLHQLVEARGETLGKAAAVVQKWWRQWLARKQEATAASEGRLMGALAALVAELQGPNAPNAATLAQVLRGAPGAATAANSSDLLSGLQPQQQQQQQQQYPPVPLAAATRGAGSTSRGSTAKAASAARSRSAAGTAAAATAAVVVQPPPAQSNTPAPIDGTAAATANLSAHAATAAVAASAAAVAVNPPTNFPAAEAPPTTSSDPLDPNIEPSDGFIGMETTALATSAEAAAAAATVVAAPAPAVVILVGTDARAAAALLVASDAPSPSTAPATAADDAAAATSTLPAGSLLPGGAVPSVLPPDDGKMPSGESSDEPPPSAPAPASPVTPDEDVTASSAGMHGSTTTNPEAPAAAIATPAASLVSSTEEVAEGSNSPAAGAVGANQRHVKEEDMWAAGMRVEARFGGKGKFYGAILASGPHGDLGTWEVHFDDGDVDAAVLPVNISVPARAGTLLVGQKVEGRFGGKSKFFPGTIVRDHGDGSYHVKYDDGDEEQRVTLVRARV